MIIDNLSLMQVISGFENVLRIKSDLDYVEDIKAESRRELSAFLGINLSKDIYEDYVALKLVNNSMDIMFAELTQHMKSLTLLNQLSLFSKQKGITLKHIAYAGFAEKDIKKALVYLADIELYDKRGSFFNAIVSAVDRLDRNEITRLLIIMIVMEDYGFKEGVAVIAQYLLRGLI